MMFDYDRIEFISSSQKKNIGNSNNNNFATVKHQSFDTTPTADDDEENSIAHSLKDILRHCSSSPVQNLPYNSIDSNENEVEEEGSRRTSVGSSYKAETHDCGASSGYGSPGIASTPLSLASPLSTYFAMKKMLAEQAYFDTTNYSPKGISSKSMDPIGTPTTQTSIMESPHFGQLQKSMQMIGEDDVDSFVFEPRRNSFSASSRLIDKENWRKHSVSNDDEVIGMRKMNMGQEIMKQYITNRIQKCPIHDLSFLNPSQPSHPPTTTIVTLKTTGPGTNKNTNKNKMNNITSVPITPSPADIVAEKDGFSKNEIEQFSQMLTSPRKLPPPRYICHICYQQGHYINDCPMRFNSPYEELTPYQGRKKCYGEFQCEQCKRKWTSQNSVANDAQSCIKCQIPVYPHKQLPVDKAIALGLIKTQVNTTLESSFPPNTPTMKATPILGGPPAHLGSSIPAMLVS